jgi:CheY-like chemotaxis protein
MDSALDTLSRFSPNSIISDIAMPEHDGYELITRVRQDRRFDEIPAIAPTGLASPEDRDRALAAGFQAHLTKPIELAALVATVHRVWRAQVLPGDRR